MAGQRQQSLLHYLGEHEPDLERRGYLKKLGLPTSEIELSSSSGEMMNTQGRVLSVPPPARSLITGGGHDTQEWLRRVKGEDGPAARASQVANGGQEGAGGGQSLVTPLLWIPGVLKSQGAWATAMKETIDGPALAAPGVTLIKSEFVSATAPGPTSEEELLAKDQLIQELERSLAKQKVLMERVVHKSKKHSVMYSKMMEKARREEMSRNDSARAQTVGVLETRVSNLREDLRTTKKASAARAKRAYAQENFLSQYAKALTTVREQAQDIADVEHTALRNQVSALKRQLRRDAAYKKALKERTEIAEMSAEKRWMEAEVKIPQLEVLINKADTRFAQDRLFNQERSHRHKREIERLNQLLRREQDARVAAEAHSNTLQRRLANRRESGWPDSRARSPTGSPVGDSGGGFGASGFTTSSPKDSLRKHSAVVAGKAGPGGIPPVSKKKLG